MGEPTKSLWVRIKEKTGQVALDQGSVTGLLIRKAEQMRSLTDR